MRKYLSVYESLLLLLLLLLIFALIVNLIADKRGGQEAKGTPQVYTETTGLCAGTGKWLEESISEEDSQKMVEAFKLEEQEIYSFLQGPRSWNGGIPWSGEWCQFNVNGNSFGGFGCGLCCMANIYDTLSYYEVSPWDMCEYAMTVSNYAPDGKAGAIGWKDMRDTLRLCGMECKLYRKPKTYEGFRNHIKKMKSAVVLVCSGNDDTYWQDTAGHYVNIWLYQEEDETVFLAEPGSPENNRTRIPLRYVYDALKTVSKFQYLAVESYWEEHNQWKGNGIDESWNRP